MFRVWHSNRLDVLKQLTAHVMEHVPLASPFEQEVVLVQSPGMAQWLQMELAEQFTAKIAANIRFPLPASFIWDMFVSILPDIPGQSAFNKTAMGWKLMTILPDMIEQPAFDSLHHYLQDDPDQRRLFQLSHRVADLFDQYLVYRPEWLNSWQQHQLIGGLGDAQIWQAALWRALVNYTATLGQPGWHRANLYSRFIRMLETATQCPPGLPSRVFICGISSLPPVYLQALKALGRHIDIHLLLTNPCQFYWGDIQDRSQLARLQIRRRKIWEQTQLSSGITESERPLFRDPAQAGTLFNHLGEQNLANPLLASWGKQGRDNLYLLAQMDGLDNDIDAFVQIDPVNLLSQLQRDILCLEDHSLVGLTARQFADSQQKRLLSADDHSLCLNACHSAQREIEVLQDYLLTLMDENPHLTPRDIIVMVADIDSYTPCIQAVFSRAGHARYIPFSISDRRASQAHPVIQAFLQLLSLPESRFTSEQVLALLEVPALAVRFSMDGAHLQILRRWVEASGIRWGLDDESIAGLSLPVTGQNTWQFGVARMLLGYALESDQGEWQGILPFDESAGLMGELAGQLAAFLSELAHWRKVLNQSRPLDEWLPWCRQLTEAFFAGDADAQSALEIIHEQWRQVIQQGTDARYQAPVPMVLLRDELSGRLEQERVSQRFLAGQMNFCTLMPMRSIPFKVVCLLGMNDAVYPRSVTPLGFDLMQQKPERGDRSRRNDDRYLFLEALMSARDHLYISYIGRNIQDNQPRLPSVLVTELLEYVSQSFCLAEDSHQDVDTSARRVLEHLVKRQSRTPFAPENFDPASRWQSYAREWMAAARAAGKALPEFQQPLEEKRYDQVSLEAFLSFWRHPIRAWFTRRLGVHFSYQEVTLPESEPFVPTPLNRYQLNQQLLNTLIQQQDGQDLCRRQQLSGQLPCGPFGRIFWQQQSAEMAEIAAQVIPQCAPAIRLEVDLQVAGQRLTGWLAQVQPDGLLRWRPGKLDFSDGICLWIEHLICCALGHPAVSRMYGRQGTQWRFMPLAPKQAKTRLDEMMAAYVQGMHQPLWLLKGCGGNWLKASLPKKGEPDIDWREETQQAAIRQLVGAWQEGYLTPGEGSDPYLRRLSRQLTLQQTEAICQAAAQWYLPVYQAHCPQQDDEINTARPHHERSDKT